MGENIDDDISVQATIFGERHDPASTMSLTGVKPQHLNLQYFAKMIAHGIISNTVQMFTTG